VYNCGFVDREREEKDQAGRDKVQSAKGEREGGKEERERNSETRNEIEGYADSMSLASSAFVDGCIRR